MNKANIESLKWKANALGFQKEMMVNEYSGMAYGMRNEFRSEKAAGIIPKRNHTSPEK